ncbi:MAG TPA: integrin alpha [Gammaproteobacteria bacterium]|nr:integrin alpha [Gammaproteobacteria bacterium]
MPNTSNHFISPLELSTLNGIIGVTFNGIAAGDLSGYSVASAGDVNRDGFKDVLIGAYPASPRNLSQAGSIYLIFGHGGTWNSSLALGSLNGTNGVVINGVATNDRSGYSVASAGDVNGDGFDDVLIGAYQASLGNLSQTGSAYLIFGQGGAWSSPLALESLNGTNGVVINGAAANDRSGFAVASAGDVNGDGFDDLLISAPGNGCAPAVGSTYLIFGHAGAWGSPLALGSLNGTNGIVINGVVGGDWGGWSVASAGDVNGDGFDDLLISAPELCSSAVGSTYLIFGHAGAWSSPLALSSLNGANGVVINGIAAGDRSGIAIARAGDMNGDGIDDLVIGGAAGASLGGFFQAGSTYLIFGHRGAWSSPLMLGDLNGTKGVVINGVTAGEEGGRFVASAGDLNMDGINDVMIGDFLASPGGAVEAGSTYLIFGHRGSWDSPFALASLNGTNGVVVNGIAGDDRSGFSVASAGDVNGDGISDVLIGAYQASPGNLSQAGSTHLIFGDSLELLINTLAINQGETVFLNNSMLSAWHPNNLAINASIPFRITNVMHGNFSTLNFSQIALSQNAISFTHDNSTYAPSFEVTVGSWAIAGPTAAMINFNLLPNATTSSVPSIETTNLGAIVSGTVAVGTAGFVFFVLPWYFKKKTNEQFQKMLLESTSDADKAFNKGVVRPIANKIFNVINTTGFFGRRSEADTMAYMMAIGKIISELRRQNANLDFNEMEPVDKESFLNEIANQTRQQSLPKQKGFFGNCARYFKVEVTPQEIEHAAEGIALASVAWQSRHMGGVSAKSTSLGLELGKLSRIGFPIEAANEGVPPEKQFKLMQNHVKAVEQRITEEQEERKRLEERVAELETELIFFRQQGAGVLKK